jgi:hypothetical protein
MLYHCCQIHNKPVYVLLASTGLTAIQETVRGVNQDSSVDLVASSHVVLVNTHMEVQQSVRCALMGGCARMELDIPARHRTTCTAIQQLEPQHVSHVHLVTTAVEDMLLRVHLVLTQLLAWKAVLFANQAHSRLNAARIAAPNALQERHQTMHGQVALAVHQVSGHM